MNLVWTDLVASVAGGGATHLLPSLRWLLLATGCLGLRAFGGRRQGRRRPGVVLTPPQPAPWRPMAQLSFAFAV
jgi:hypothetical protein